MKLFGYACTDQFSIGIRDCQCSNVFVIEEPVEVEKQVVFITVYRRCVISCGLGLLPIDNSPSIAIAAAILCTEKDGYAPKRYRTLEG